MLTILVRGELSQEERERIVARCPDARIVCGEKQDFDQHLPAADIVWGAMRPSQIPLGQRLKLIQVQSAGVDHMLSPELTQSSARLCTASGIHSETIAEHVLGMMLSLVRGYAAHIRNQQKRVWKPMEPELLHGKTLGIVGFGAIGQAIGFRARAFGMRVIGMRKTPSPSPAAHEVWADDRLDELMPLVHHLVLAVPLTNETRGLVNGGRLELLQRGAFVYNIARGDVIDEAALTALLASGHLGGAGLDVFEKEPLPECSPLWDLPNVIITPHCAGSMPDYRERAFKIFLENLERFTQGKDLLNEVDKRAGY